jgi:hypothetical protein
MEVGEAVQFFEIVQKKRAAQVAEPARPVAISKDMISGPRHFKHVSHVGFDARDGRVIVDNVSQDMAQLLQQQQQRKESISAASIPSAAFRSPPVGATAVRYPNPPQQPLLSKQAAATESASSLVNVGPPTTRPIVDGRTALKEPLFSALHVSLSRSPMLMVSHAGSKSVPSGSRKMPPPPPPRRTKIAEPPQASSQAGEKVLPVVPPRPSISLLPGHSDPASMPEITKKPTPPPPITLSLEASMLSLPGHKVSSESGQKNSSNSMRTENIRAEETSQVSHPIPAPRQTPIMKESMMPGLPRVTEAKVPALSPSIVLPIIPPPQKIRDMAPSLTIVPPPPPPPLASELKKNTKKLDSSSAYLAAEFIGTKEIQDSREAAPPTFSPLADSFEELSLRPTPSSSNKTASGSSSRKQEASLTNGKQGEKSALQVELDRKMAALDREILRGDRQPNKIFPVDRATMPAKRTDLHRQGDAGEDVTSLQPNETCLPRSPPPPPPVLGPKLTNACAVAKAATGPPPPPPPTKPTAQNAPRYSPSPPSHGSPVASALLPPKLDDRAQLMEAIRQGKPLKKRPPNEETAAVQEKSAPPKNAFQQMLLSAMANTNLSPAASIKTAANADNTPS